MNVFLLIEMRRFLISISTWLIIIYAAKAEKETASLPISILQKLLELMPQKIKMPKAAPLISHHCFVSRQPLRYRPCETGANQLQ